MTNPIANYLEHLRSLAADPLAVARRAARTGRRVVGYCGNDVPVALIAAADSVPVRLRGLTPGATPRADQFLESAHTPEMRAIVEQWLAGAFDFMAAVIFPRTDDSAQRVYYYLCELQRRRLCGGPRPLLYDVANIARPTSSDYTRESTRRLAAELGVKGLLLDAAVSRVAQREALLCEVRSRRATTAPLPGTIAAQIERGSACDWRAEFDAATRSWLAQAPTLNAPRRVLLAGDAPAGDAMHRAIEDGGGSVVLELTESTPEAMTLQPDLLTALGDHFHSRRNPVLAMREDGEWLAGCARRIGADAVAIWLIEEDEALPWEIARQVTALESQRVPTLLLSRQRWIADESTLQRLRDFAAHPEAAR